MPLTSRSFTRYLPVTEKAEQWGWQLVDAGRQEIAPGAPYPDSGHPLGYLFSEDGRRVLDEFQIIYLDSGTGFFESASCPLRPVGAGEALLLFPGEWHRYCPDENIGWTEYWAGFQGREADRVMATFFTPERPVLTPYTHEPLVYQFEQLLQAVCHPVEANELVLGSCVTMLLALLQAGPPAGHGEFRSGDSIVNAAKSRFLENVSGRMDIEALAKSLGMSYSSFRVLFRRQTGYSPRAYENRIKLNRARDLLLSDRHNVTTTAEALGFSSVYYFSRVFRKAFGLSPQAWIRQQLAER